jgi:hypothetical protein
MRRPPWWLAALILLVPAAVTVAVVISRADRDAGVQSAAPSAPAADYEIGAPMLPVRTAVLDEALPALPTPESCEALLSWAADRGPAAVNIGRVDLKLTATRLLQVTVDDVAVAVTSVRPATAKSMLQCDTSDGRARWDPLPGDDRFTENITVHGGDYFTQAPVVTLDGVRVLPVVYDTPPDDLGEKVMTVAAGEHVRLPFYVVRNPTGSAEAVALTVTARLTINGRPRTHEFAATMHVLPEQQPGVTRHEWLTDERRWAKDRVRDPAGTAPSPRGGSYECEVFTDADLADPLGADIEAFAPTDGACAWTGRQEIRVELYSTRHPDEQAAREDHRRAVANFAGVEGVTSRPLPGVGTEATLLSSGFVLARSGRDTIQVSIDKYPGDSAAVLTRLIRVAAAQLWSGR